MFTNIFEHPPESLKIKFNFQIEIKLTRILEAVLKKKENNSKFLENYIVVVEFNGFNK